MPLRFLPALLLVALSMPTGPAVAQSGDSTRYTVWNHDRAAGAMTVRRTADSAIVRYRYQDRQRGPRLEVRYRLGDGGRVEGLEVRGLSAAMFPTEGGETFRRRGDEASWANGADSGRVVGAATAFYLSPSNTPFQSALLARHLLAQPGQGGRLLPVGQARAVVAAETTLVVGAAPRRLRLVMVDLGEGAPGGVWLDDRGELVASESGWFTSILDGAERHLEALRAIETRWHRSRAAELARRMAPPSASVLAIRGGDLFDSERGEIRPRQTILVRGDRIAAVGPVDSVAVPAGATVIDATGRTVIPGMWDMHTHLALSSLTDAPLMQLAAGITTIRDMAADIPDATWQRDEAARGSILSPRVILGGFIEGPGAWAGPSAVLVRTEDEARAWVARYDSLGYRQIKLYNLVHPDLVPVIAEEAHKRGMRLSGHIPRGLSLPAAVTLGFDEFQHAAFLFSTFYPDSLFIPRMRAYSNFANEIAPTFDVWAPRVTELIGFLRQRGTVVDGTFNIWQDRSRPLADGTDAVFGPTIAWMGPVTRRAMATSPLDPATGARLAAQAANYRTYLKRLYDAGVTLVAGTDNVAGLSYHGELEIYERAGIPASAVLQIATIVPARVMGDTASYGSIAPGKVADLAIVAGKPHQRITDLRKVETVVRAGRPYRSRDLWRAAGLTPL